MWCCRLDLTTPRSMLSLAHYPGGPAPSRPELIANDEKGAILPSRSSTWVGADRREAVDPGSGLVFDFDFDLSHIGVKDSAMP